MKKLTRAKKLKIAFRFREFRLRQNLSQKKLSEKLKVSKTTISKIENMKSLPSIELLLQLIETFDLSPKWLFFGMGEMTNSVTRNYCPQPYQEEFDDLLFHLENVPMVREYILSIYLLFRFKNKGKISKYLEDQNIISVNNL